MMTRLPLFSKCIWFCVLSLLFLACQEKVPESKNGVVWLPEIHLSVEDHETTVGEFRKFIEETSYITTADSFGWAGVFSPVQHKWTVVDSANWEYPYGRQEAKADDNFPVTQVSYYDACAYCSWKKGRLPTAKEWDAISQEPTNDGNVWQGLFPLKDLGSDGYHISPAPIKQFEPNASGIYDLYGNVWEWTSSTTPEDTNMIIKGGSFLCAPNYCSGYIPARFQKSEKNSSLNHLGFRCVYDK